MSLVPPPKVDRFSLGEVVVKGDHGVFRVLARAIGKLEAEADPRSARFASTIECSDWCNVVALTAEDELVLIYQHRFGTDSITLEIPGGAIDMGESPEIAAARELLEETGYAATSFEPLAVVHPNPAIQANRCFSFLARGAKKVSEPSFDTNESCEVVLVPRSETARLIDEGHVTHALAVLALERALRLATRDGAGATKGDAAR